jgi:hypothetical protein
MLSCIGAARWIGCREAQSIHALLETAWLPACRWRMEDCGEGAWLNLSPGSQHEAAMKEFAGAGGFAPGWQPA